MSKAAPSSSFMAAYPPESQTSATPPLKSWLPSRTTQKVRQVSSSVISEATWMRPMAMAASGVEILLYSSLAMA